MKLSLVTVAVVGLAVGWLCGGWAFRLETDYSKAWATEHAGTPEFKLPDGTRIDVLTDTRAVEFEYPKKWAESLGQALYTPYVRKPRASSRI